MAKVGRPKIENPKVNKISVRLSDEEHEKLIEFIHGMFFRNDIRYD